ncbi:uncharacterized protein [Lepeophtheirus salmonis]|uniref:uncharacterized protein n=1 Tax=Lepeophtheirus salmonis TaxID=72036 RepID=UPI001AE886F2|nr:uncharacterized protein LOC121118430 [Lepeophtheirus salmonis]XP_040568950.1 uncharacterized protein LOC121118430 [Lepeophtheirus salmonis]
MDRVCQFYLRGRCNRNNCEFKHVKPVEDAANASIYRKTPCRFFEANGSCRFGDNCRFFHDAASNKKYNASKSTPIVDSDDDIPRGADSDDDSIVSGFTEYTSIVAKKTKRGLSDKQDEAKSCKTQKVIHQDEEKEETMESRKNTSVNNKEKESKKSIVHSPSLDDRLKNFEPKNLPTARKSSMNENSPSNIKSLNASDKSNTSMESLIKADNELLKRAPLMVAKKSVPQIFDNRSGIAKESKIKKIVPELNKKIPTKEVTLKKVDSSLSSKIHESITTMDSSKLDKQSEIETVETIESFIKVNETANIGIVDERSPNKSGAEWENLMSGEECITSIGSASTDITMEEAEKEVPPLILRKSSFSNSRLDKKGVGRSKSDETSKSKNSIAKPVGKKGAESGIVNKKVSKEGDIDGDDDEEDENMDESSDWISSIEESNSDDRSDSSISGRTKIRIKKLTPTKTNNKILKNSANLKALQPIKCDICQLRKGFKKKNCLKCIQLQKGPVDESTSKLVKRGRGRPKLNKTVTETTAKTDSVNVVHKQTIEEKPIYSPEKKEEEKKVEEKSPICKPHIIDKPKKHVSETLELPKFDPDKFKPGYIPSIVKKGDEEYAVVVTGVKDTGLCGTYWGDLNNLPSRRKSRINNPFLVQETPEVFPPKGKRAKKVSSSSKETSEPKTPVATKRNSSENSQLMKSANEKTKTKSPIASSSQTPVTIKSPTNVKTTVNGSGVKKIPSQSSLKRTRKESPSKPTGEYETNSPTTTNSHSESASETPSVSSEYFSSPSALSNMSMQKERFAPYDDNRWVSIGKDLINNSFDAVQYTRALRLPFHLLSFLRIKGNSVKGMSCTDKNNMVFVVIEGEITVALQGSTSNFDCKKGDSFYIPPKNNYNLMNNKAREAELCIFQFANEGVIPPNSASVSSESVKSPTHQSK